MGHPGLCTAILQPDRHAVDQRDSDRGPERRLSAARSRPTTGPGNGTHEGEPEKQDVLHTPDRS